MLTDKSFCEILQINLMEFLDIEKENYFLSRMMFGS